MAICRSSWSDVARIAILQILVAMMATCLTLAGLGQDFPQFQVPGFEDSMQRLEEMHRLHHDGAFSDCTLWDGWLPQSTLWVSQKKRDQYRRSLIERRIDEEGYVAMQQHRGMAHSDGWPFPAWQQSGGVGFHFSTRGEDWAIQNFRLEPLNSLEGWQIEGAERLGIDPKRGLELQGIRETLCVTTPAFRCESLVAPFLRLEWSCRHLPHGATARIEWLLDGETQWPSERFLEIPLPLEGESLQYRNLPLHRDPRYSGVVTRYRITIAPAIGGRITLKSILTAVDTRHPITNALFVRACVDYFHWTQDTDFLRASLPRMRRAIDFALREFSVATGHHVDVPWVGHDGRSGIVFSVDGSKQLRPGIGVGNNYWDLLPFGAHDAIATMYLHDALSGIAALERTVRNHPEWQIPARDSTSELDAWEKMAASIRADFQTRFWNPSTGRFVGWIDRDGRAYDYGFTFVNLEAIHYGLASPSQSREILDWISGRRIVAGDTSTGNDIYHWRFGPRATTRRNIETYGWVWSQPESIPWGNQVQDGGAVLGFSYFDLMARLRVEGPDAAWSRLQEILAWFEAVQSEGGYRTYYSQPGRGSLQGGGPPGGLGLDREFMESVLVPQVMLYGFLGFQPTSEGCEVHPRLPSAWGSLTITNIHWRDEVINISVHPDGAIDVIRNPPRP